jgi:hypothetical protein
MLLIFSVLSAACSSTTLTSTSRDAGYRGKIHKAYIVGMTSRDINRYDFEDALSNELQAQGVTALSSYKDGNFPVDLDEQAIAARAFANGADTVLMAQVLGKYGRQYAVDYQPATATEYQVVTLEVTLYETKTGKPIWSAQFETVLDRRYELLFRDLAKSVVNDLRTNGLI